LQKQYVDRQQQVAPRYVAGESRAALEYAVALSREADSLDGQESQPHSLQPLALQPHDHPQYAAMKGDQLVDDVSELMHSKPLEHAPAQGNSQSPAPRTPKGEMEMGNGN
jgi:cytochrome c5